MDNHKYVLKVRIIKPKKEIMNRVCQCKFAIQDRIMSQILKSNGLKWFLFCFFDSKFALAFDWNIVAWENPDHSGITFFRIVRKND